MGKRKFSSGFKVSAVQLVQEQGYTVGEAAQSLNAWAAEQLQLAVQNASGRKAEGHSMILVDPLAKLVDAIVFLGFIHES